MSYGERAEALDSKWVFRSYAILAGVGGFLLMGWGPMWLGTDLGGEKWAKAALIRVFGAILMGAACAAEGFTRVGDPADRRRAMIWFACGNSVVFGVLILQQTTIWGRGLGEKAAEVLGTVVVVLLGAAFDGKRRETTLNLRPRYEQQIREAGRQEERNRLARDLHDSIKQQIFVIQTAAATVEARLDEDPAGARAAAEQVRGAAREAMTEMQAMLDQMRAVPLENTGLAEALKKQCEALGFRTGAKVELTIGNLPAARDWPPGSHEAVLRAAQEALANIGRHARATNVTVSLSGLLGRIELRVDDDGSGFDTAQASGGQGIANMRARAEELGGMLELKSRPGAGAMVVFSFPYQLMESPEQCRRKMFIWAALLCFQAVLAWPLRGPVLLSTTMFLAFWFVWYLRAWRRALKRAEAAR